MWHSNAAWMTHDAEQDKPDLSCLYDPMGVCLGVDALSVHLILTVIAATLSIGISWKAVVGSLGIMIPWQLAHWEEYHTGGSQAACCCSLPAVSLLTWRVTHASAWRRVECLDALA